MERIREIAEMMRKLVSGGPIESHEKGIILNPECSKDRKIGKREKESYREVQLTHSIICSYEERKQRRVICVL